MSPPPRERPASAAKSDEIVKKLVLELPRKGRRSPEEIADIVAAVPGVVVLGTSRAFLDLQIDDEDRLQELLDSLRALDCRLHEAPAAQLMDPIPPSKIPL